MSFTARSVIEQARLRHEAFDERTLPESILLPLLDSYVRRIRSKVIEVMPSKLLQQHSASVPAAEDFESGITLPPLIVVTDVTAFSGSGSTEYGEGCRIIPYEQRWESGYFPAVFVVRETLYLKGDPSAWASYSSLLVSYVPQAPALTNLDSNILLPDSCEMACVENLAAVCGVRLSRIVTPDVVMLLREIAEEAQTLALNDLTQQRSQETWVMKES
jgi:hypothetical protein